MYFSSLRLTAGGVRFWRIPMFTWSCKPEKYQNSWVLRGNTHCNTHGPPEHRVRHHSALQCLALLHVDEVMQSHAKWLCVAS